MTRYSIDKKKRQATLFLRRKFGRLHTLRDAKQRNASSRISIRNYLLSKQLFCCPGLLGLLDLTSKVACKNRPTECDHIIEIRHKGRDTKSNLQMLCRGCHVKKTSANYGSQKLF